MFLVYFHAFTGKLRVTEWLDGTVMYYWINDPVFGTAWPLKGLINPLFLNGTFNAMVTWSVLGAEFFLAAGLIAKSIYKPWLFWIGIFLHTSTIFIHGLPSFAMIMFAALTIYLLPVEKQILIFTYQRKTPALKTTNLVRNAMRNFS